MVKVPSTGTLYGRVGFMRAAVLGCRCGGRVGWRSMLADMYAHYTDHPLAHLNPAATLCGVPDSYDGATDAMPSQDDSGPAPCYL